MGVHHRKTGRSLLVLITFAILLTTSRTNGLNISSNYQSYLRPNDGAVADIVNISIDLISIRQIHENDMEFTADFTIRKYWTDPRLIGAVKKETLFIHYVPAVWIPDLYITNSANSKHPDDYSRATRIKPDGQVMLSERIASQVSCDMGFAAFPFDRQVCQMNLKSYGYTTIHLDMVWHGMISQNVPVFHNEYSFVSAEQSTRTDKTSTGEFRVLTLTFTLRRSGVRYLRRAIIPTTILAIISYLTLFIQLRKRKSENSMEVQKEAEAQGTVSPTLETVGSSELELTTIQMGLIRLLVNGLMVLIFVFIGQINLLNAPATSTVTGLDVWLVIVGLIVFILFVQSLLTLILGPNQKYRSGEKIQESLVQKVDRNLLYGVPVFFLVFAVIYFAVYLS